MSKISLFWFRRDLRLDDNRGLFEALSASSQVQPIFIFDTKILKKLKNKQDRRVQFIHETLKDLKKNLNEKGGDIWTFHGEPLAVFKKLVKEHKIEAVFTNEDYEPYARQRDTEVREFLTDHGIAFHSFKDQVIFAKDEVVSNQGQPYTVYTPYKKKWLSTLTSASTQSFSSGKILKNLFQTSRAQKLPDLKDLGFQASPLEFSAKKITTEFLKNYAQKRDFPAVANSTSHLSLHLRFGTLSPRHLVSSSRLHSPVWLSELIWREFFMQILWNFPRVEQESFRPIYDKISWRTSEKDFLLWCQGKTGYPIVDAGIRELNATGYMHNRVRMITASFLCKHLLLHWSWGEKYFAEKLNDYDLAANNGNWQWVAGSGCDASPYFRVFNPEIQQKKFDPDENYIRHWIPEYGTKKYPEPMIEHRFAVDRALREYTKVLKGKRS